MTTKQVHSKQLWLRYRSKEWFVYNHTFSKLLSPQGLRAGEPLQLMVLQAPVFDSSGPPGFRALRSSLTAACQFIFWLQVGNEVHHLQYYNIKII